MICSKCGGECVGGVESDPGVCSSCHLKKIFVDNSDEEPYNKVEFTWDWYNEPTQPTTTSTYTESSEL